MSAWDFPFPESWLEAWHTAQHKGPPATLSPEMLQAFVPGLSTVRSCIDCGCLVAGGPTRCNRCAKEAQPSEPVKADMVNHPPHYTFGRFEVIDVVEDWKLDFALGNAIKYIARAAHKGDELADLKKARWYLERRISQLGRQLEEQAARHCVSGWHEHPAPGLDRCPDCGASRDHGPAL